MEKELNIVPPEGWEIDKEKSTFEKIIFKEIKKVEVCKLPMRWEDLPVISGYFTGTNSTIYTAVDVHPIDCNTNVFPTKEFAEASLALAQLLQLRDAWNDGWIPNFGDDTSKSTIYACNKKLVMGSASYTNAPMSFKSTKTRDKFLETFKDLLEIAKPLL